MHELNSGGIQYGPRPAKIFHRAYAAWSSRASAQSDKDIHFPLIESFSTVEYNHLFYC